MAIRRKEKNGERAWYGRIKDPKTGRPREKKCASQLEALQWEEAARLDTPDVTRPDTVSIGALVNLYLDHLDGQVRRHQIQAKYVCEVRRAIVPFANFIGPRAMAMKIVKRQVGAYLDIVADTITINTSRVHHKHIKRLMNWAHDELDWPRDWLRLPPPLKRNKPVRRPSFSADEMVKLMGAATDMERLMLELFIETAARKNELFGLKWSDVDLGRGSVTLTTNKGLGGVVERTVPLPVHLAAKLRKHRKEGMETVFVFTNPDTGTRFAGNSTALDRLSKRAGVKKVPGRAYHGLRRLAAVSDKEHARRRLGHLRETTTDLYLEQLGAQDEMPCLLDRIGKKKAPEPKGSKASSGE